MKRGTDLGEENLAILSTQCLERSIPNLFQNLATSNTWLCIHSRKGLVVVSGLEVVFLLFSKLERQPGNDGWQDS